MTTSVFTTVKVCLLAFVLAQIQHSENKGLMYDITESVNGLLGGNTSIGDFQRDLSSTIDLASSKNRIPRIFFAIESETLDVLAAQIGQVAQVIHDISRKQILILAVSLRVDITSEQELFTRQNTSFEIETATFPNIRLAIILNVHAKTICFNFKSDGKSNETLSLTRLEMFRKLFLTISQSDTARIGIGFDFALFNCKISPISTLLEETKVDLSMFNIDFGETDGIIESLTLFEREVESLHRRVQLYYQCVIFRPIPESIVDKVRKSLWNKYSEIVATSTESCSDFILQKPLMQKDKIDKSQSFQVIPHVNSLIYKKYRIERRIFWLPIMFEARLKGFDTLLLTLGQWLAINSVENLEIYTKYQPSAGKPPLKVIVDLSNEKTRCALAQLPEECWNNNLTQLEAELLDQGIFNTTHPVKHIVLEAVLFEIETNSAQQYKPTTNLSFVRNLSSKVTIGCSFRAESFSLINSSKVVEACKTINGNLYVFKWSTNLEWRNNKYENVIYYEKYIRKELYKIKKIRDKVQQADPQSTVYFHVYPTKVNKIHYNGKK